MVKDIMNPERIEKAKVCTIEVIKLNNIEEHMLNQRTKIKWLRDGDNNNAYLHAS